MATQYEIDLALMAGRAYYDTRADINRFPVPDGWTEFFHVPNETFPSSSGFEAVSFQRGDEIVISYAGTYDKSFGDLATDLALGVFGVSSTQLYQAAEYYMQVKAANASNSNAKITLTGHSLGGGLASLVAVFFNETATTFDQAPFRNSASWVTATALRTYLNLNFPASTYPQISDWLAPLDRFIVSFDPLGLGWSQDGLDAREAKVTNLSVQGEFLSIANALRIGSELPPLTHGDYFGPFDLHAQSLLTAFVQNDQFRQVTLKLTDLLGMIFDNNLYFHDPNDKDNPERNFLENLIRHQEGLDPAVPNDGDAMLDRFTTDLQLIAQDGGLTMANNDLTKALTAFAMQAYYSDRLAASETLFESVAGGISFNRYNVADTLDGDTGAKGYTMYFTNYLATLPANDRALIVAQLPDLLDWYIQAGSQAMNATAETQRAFMLGGSGDDTLTGGNQADLLVGNGGMDNLNGGAGADLMIGGEGMDTYYLDGNDTILDTGRNFIVYQGQVIAGAFLREGTSNTYSFLGDNNFTLTFDSVAHLTVNGTDSITFEQQTSAADFANGDFGITLYDSVEGERTLTGTSGDDSTGALVFQNEGRYYFSGAISGSQPSFDLYPDWGEFTMIGTTPPNLTINGGDGNDQLIGLAGSDSITGGSGNDLIFGEFEWVSDDPAQYALLNPWGDIGQADILQGEAGKDVIGAGYGDDVVSGGEDNDFLEGGAGNDTVGGDSGNDVVTGSIGNDLLLGGAGNDLLYGDSILDLGLIGTADIAALNFKMSYATKGYATKVILENFAVVDAPESGDDMLYGGVGNDMLKGGGGNDTLLGEADHDNLIGGNGDDYLDGGAGNDWLVGDDSTSASSGRDTLFGGAGDDRLEGNGGDDFLDGSAGADTLYGENGNDTVFGGEGKDILAGGMGKDFLDGGIGDDSLYGEEGDDTLHGGAGNDYLAGGAGNDIYVFGRGDGQDSIYETDGEADTIRLNDVLPGDLRVTRTQYDLSLAINGTGDSLAVAGWFNGNASRIEQVEFSDGTIWDATSLEGKIAAAPGTSGNDVLYGGTGNDIYVLSPGGGADIIQFDPDGYDTMAMGVGYDASALSLFKSGSNMIVRLNDGTQFTFTGWFSASQYPIENFAFADGSQLTNAEFLAGSQMQSIGNAGNNPLYGYEGADTISGGAGYDYLYGYGGTDYLDGGPGNDYLSGGAGSDIYLFERGSGWDTIVDPEGRIYTDPAVYQDDVDTIRFGEGIAPADLHLTWDGCTWDGYSLELTIGSSGDDGLRVEPASFSYESDSSYYGYAFERIIGIERIEFRDGTVWTFTELLARLMDGTEGADWLYGTGAADTITGNGDNDRLEGFEGNDTMDGGDGDDCLFGGDGSDTLIGGAGDDILYGNSGGRYYTGEDNNTLIGGDGNDTLYSDEGDDIMGGGAGNDTLYGGDGNDLYLFGRGDGQDVIYNSNTTVDGWRVGWLNPDIVRFDKGVTPTDIVVSRDGDNLSLAISGTEDRLSIADWFGSFTAAFNRGEQLEFSDGTVWDISDLARMVAGTSESILVGTEENDILTGGDGVDSRLDDVLVGNGGADRLKGGLGCDWLDGGNGDDLLYGDTESGSWLSGIMDDGLNGGAGNDILYGGAGRDMLFGGNGNDVLYGGEGDDTYLFNLGDGVDTINDHETVDQDILSFGPGITPSDLTDFTKIDNDLTVKVGTNGDQLTFINWFGGISGQVDVAFAEGMTLTASELMARTPFYNLHGSSSTDYLYGGAGDDVLEGGDGNDYLYSYGGNDQLLGGSGDDLLDGGWGVDFLDGGDGNDHLFGYSGTDQLIGGTGNDIYYIDNSYYGIVNEGFDEGTDEVISVTSYTLGENIENLTLIGTEDLSGTGNSLNNVITGNSGANFLDGGDGDDVYIFGRGAGQDRIYNWDWEQEFYDVIRFRPDVAPSEVIVERVAYSDNDLMLSIRGTYDTLTLPRFFDPDYGQNVRIDAVEFANGRVWDAEYLAALASGAVSADVVLSGTADDEVLTGGMGNDTIDGGAGNDTLAGGAGADVLTGGVGNDTYLYNPGDGVDEINDTALPDEGNVLVFGQGIIPDSLSLGMGSLLIRTGTDEDAIHIANFNPDDVYGEHAIETFQFADNATLSYAQLLAKGFDLTGAAGDDLISGTNAVDRITGLDGNDTINGGADNDVLDGGAGNDTLAGGQGDDLLMGGDGDDTYLYNSDDGADRITDSEGSNTLALGNGLTAADLNAERQGDDLVLRMPAAWDPVVLTDWFLHGATDGINTITFADGTGLDRAGMEGLLNRPPVAGTDQLAPYEDAGPLTISATNLLVNDTDPNPGDTLSVTAVGSSEIGAAVSFTEGQITYDIGDGFQQLAAGEVVQDSFSYTVSDSQGATAEGIVLVDITGTNDAPVVGGDTASTVEDAVQPITGNVLANDLDIDNGTVLNVANPGECQGRYGILALAADGGYSYSLDNTNSAVQSFGRETVVAEHFTYTATDGIVSVASALVIALTGSNDAPILAALLADQQVNFHKDFSWQLPQGSFTDPDAGDTLEYSATLADGSALPTWLAFDPATQTFSGHAPKQTGSVEVRVTATDKVAVSGNTEGSLSTSDLFQLDISHGNEGVGNGEDAPPAGHDSNCNDGPGTAPGKPGRRGGHDDGQKWNSLADRDEDHAKIPSQDSEGQDSWGQPQRVQPAYLNASHWDERQSSATAKSGEQVDPSVVFGRWLTMDLAVSKALAEKKTLSWLDERLGADTIALSKAGSGFLGSTATFGTDLFSLQAGQGQELKGFKGLGEGLRKVA